MELIRKTLQLRLWVCFLCLAGCASKVVIDNRLTPKHQNIRGTGVSLIPPEGFSPASTFVGLESDSHDASILVIETEAPFSEVNASFSPEMFEMDGMHLLESKPATVGKLAGRLYTFGRRFSQCVLTNRPTPWGLHILNSTSAP